MGTERRWQLTGRDVAILEWMGRWRAVTAPQIRREFVRRDPANPLHIRKAEERLRALNQMGLTDRRRVFARSPGVHWLTREGARVVDVSGALNPPKVAELEHDLAVVDLAHHLGNIQPSHQLVTEQEIRRLEPNPAAGPESALRSDIELGAGRGTGGRAYPDLASVVEGSQVWVHELERTRKGRPRLVRIMLSYVYAEHIAGAVYWAYPHLYDGVQAAADEANRSAEAAGQERCIIVNRWDGLQPETAA